SYDCTVTGVVADFTNSATATGTPPIGADVTSTDTAIVDVVDPSITITKDPATQTILTGTNATFSITVTNTGDVDLSNVAVADPLVPACDNSIGLLVVGGSVTYPCEATAVALGFTNLAIVGAVGPLGALPPSGDTADVIVLEATLAGRVWLDLNGDAAQDVGEPGAGGVSVDLLDGSLVVVGSTVTDGNGDYDFSGLDTDTYTVRVDIATLPAGSVATADPDGTLDDETVQAVVLGDAIAGLNFGYQPPATMTGLVFVDDDGDGVQGPGEVPLAGVTVIVTDGSGVPVPIVTDADGIYSAGVVPGPVTIDVDDPTVPADHALTTANDPQVVVAVAAQVVTAPDVGYQPPTVDISLTKVSSEGNVQAGDQAEWILTIANAGTVDALGPITLTDNLPTGLTHVGSTGTGWTCTAAASVVICEHPGPLPVGSELEVRIVTDVAADLTGTVNNEALVSMPGDVNVLNNSAVAGVGLLPATGFNLADALTWSLFSLLLGGGLILVTRPRDEDHDLLRNN
ncbi:MAG: DUF11 domain-containing protein, partial [Acidimicrobiia bacterium]|nr:DUF11 domain-containing protein [Acidimicrobiia bacterium]